MGISLTATGITFPDATTQTTAKYGSYRNRIINGNMSIAQRGTSFVSPATNTYTLDRWVYSNTTSGTVTITQNVEQPNLLISGAIYSPATPDIATSLKIEVTGADTAIATADYANIAQRIEGYNISDLINTTFTISFNVRTSIAGPFCVSLRNEAGDVSYILGYTQPTQDGFNTKWGRYSFVVNGGLPSTSTWNTSTGVGLRVEFTLASGSTYYVGNPEQWYTSTTGLALSNQTNLFATVGNTFEVTGVQVEKNTVLAPQYDLRADSIELAMCQRYYCRTGASVRGYTTAAGQTMAGTVFFPQLMRAAPVCTKSVFSNLNIATYDVTDITTEGARYGISSAAAGNMYSVYGTIVANSEI